MPFPFSSETNDLMQTYLYHGPGVTIWSNVDLISWGDARTTPFFTGAGLLTPVSNPGSTVDEDDGVSSSAGSWDFAIEELQSSTRDYLAWDPIAEARVATPMPFVREDSDC